MRIILALLGMLLLGLNAAGFFVPFRNPDVYKLRTQFPHDITQTGEQTLSEIGKLKGTPAEIAEGVNELVNHGMAHYWSAAGMEAFNLRVPLTENYLLWIAAQLRPKNYAPYEYVNWKRALQRGVGLCSQQSIVVAGVLRELGVPSRIVGLSGHVVAAAQIDDQKDSWWLLDPDYGVVIPYSIQAVQKDPRLAVKYYEEKGYSGPILQTLLRVYGPEGNQVVSGVEEYFPRKKVFVESGAYLFKWLLPFLLILPWLYELRSRMASIKPAQAVKSGRR